MSVELTNPSTGYDKTLKSNSEGVLAIKQVPFGIYRLRLQETGFAPAVQFVDVHSALQDETVRLVVSPVSVQINVNGNDSLIDPYATSSVMEIGSQQIEQRLSSIPGRSVQDLVDSQPGWLYEGNAVLHPRGSEYQTQFVVDGIPLTDNRSPGSGPEIEADGLDSVSIYTAGYPAEYGRKLGGVVELNTRRQTDPGLHGEVVLSGGSYAAGSSYAQLQRVWGKNTLSGSASGSMTDHYLNPVVPQNYTNKGTTGDFSLRFERDLTDRDRFSVNLRHELTRFLIPNELLQQQAGQIQNGDTLETMGTARYQRIVSPDSVVALAGMVRDNSNDLESNQNPTPIAAFQHNSLREGYFKATYSLHHGRHELKAGIESDAIFLHENFNYTLTDPGYFDPDTPTSLSFTERRPDLEKAAFVEDTIRLGKWFVNLGERWDHYQLLLNQNAFSPRISVGRSVPSLKLVLHASFDRIFQTPAFENILLSSSAQVDALSDQFLRLPVRPSRGDYYEGGLTGNLFGRMRMDVNVYRRDARNYADDDQLLNTGVSYPIAFDKAEIYGAEAKLQLVHVGKLNGFASYSYMVGNVWFPVTGGLFLGDDASNALSQLSGHFPDSQDQRNTLRTRYQYQFAKNFWGAAGATYGSGLPFEYGGTSDAAIAQYGAEVVSRLDFARGRVKPMLAVNSSLGIDLHRSDRVKVSLQLDTDNLNDRLNVIDFGGLFSGNAVGPDRSYDLRLNTRF